MQKLYIPIAQRPQAKVIPLNASPLDEWIDVVEAAKLFVSAKHPQGIKPESLKNKIWNNKLPKAAYNCTPAGWRFHKPTLLGLKSIAHFNSAA